MMIPADPRCLRTEARPNQATFRPAPFAGGDRRSGTRVRGTMGCIHACISIASRGERAIACPRFTADSEVAGGVDDGGVHGAPSVVLGVRTAPCNCRRRARSLLASPSGLVDLRGWRSPRLHSFIHSEPHDQQRALSRFAQYIRPGGAPSRITRADRCGLIALSASAGATQRSGRAWEPARAWERLYVGRRVIPGDGRRGTLTS
jgi:hypothetical protein